ncbi:hypothetical protein MMC18_000548 [Xylographa bjoerkii]|nr:hypothetical protein [Xylographa bjoerkii]
MTSQKSSCSLGLMPHTLYGVKINGDTKAWDELDMYTPYIVALASNGGWFTAYESIGGTATWKLSLYDVQKQKIQVWQHKDDQWIHEDTSHDAYQMLAEWLPQNFANDTADFRKCSMTFGPGDSFYRIVKQMEKGGLGPPKMVSLGAEGTWAMTWDGKYHLWELGNRYYDDVHKALKSEKKDRLGGINYVAISPYGGGYFIHFNNGSIDYYSPLDTQAEKDFRHFIWKYMQERARADKITYRMTASDPGKDKMNVVISSTTRYDVDESKLMAAVPESHSPQSWISWLWKKIF